MQIENSRFRDTKCSKPPWGDVAEPASVHLPQREVVPWSRRPALLWPLPPLLCDLRGATASLALFPLLTHAMKPSFWGKWCPDLLKSLTTLRSRLNKVGQLGKWKQKPRDQEMILETYRPKKGRETKALCSEGGDMWKLGWGKMERGRKAFKERMKEMSYFSVVRLKKLH